MFEEEKDAAGTDTQELVLQPLRVGEVGSCPLYGRRMGAPTYISSWTGSPQFISQLYRPFIRGPTTRSLGDLYTYHGC